MLDDDSGPTPAPKAAPAAAAKLTHMMPAAGRLSSSHMQYVRPGAEQPQQQHPQHYPPHQQQQLPGGGFSGGSMSHQGSLPGGLLGASGELLGSGSLVGAYGSGMIGLAGQQQQQQQYVLPLGMQQQQQQLPQPQMQQHVPGPRPPPGAPRPPAGACVCSFECVSGDVGRQLALNVIWRT